MYWSSLGRLIMPYINISSQVKVTMRRTSIQEGAHTHTHTRTSIGSNSRKLCGGKVEHFRPAFNNKNQKSSR